MFSSKFNATYSKIVHQLNCMQERGASNSLCERESGHRYFFNAKCLPKSRSLGRCNCTPRYGNHLHPLHANARK